MGINESGHNRQEIYSRQIMIKEIGKKGQLKLEGASVLVVGCGGLGAPVLYYLTAMGIGHLGLCDGDNVTLSNLNRQVLYTYDDIGKPKAGTAKERLITLNPNLKTTVYDKSINQQLAKSIIKDYDIVVDCLDNYQTRFIINDACIKANKPLVHAAVGEFYGQLMTIVPGKSPCLRCLISTKESYESVSGVIGAVAGVMGSLQALEVVKFLLGLDVCCDGLLIYDGLATTFEKIKVKQAQNCICDVSS